MPYFLRWALPPLLGALAIVAFQWPLITEDPVTERDDEKLVAPLQNLEGLEEYGKKIADGRIRDLQPVRDFTYWLDIQLKKVVAGWSFHGTNVLIGVLILGLVWHLFRGFRYPYSAACIGLALVCLHPVFHNSLAWISSRKHLLALLFILVATSVGTGLTRLSGRAKGISLFAAYLLSLLSHPMFLLWPVWYYAYSRLMAEPSEETPAVKPGLLMGFVLAAVGVAGANLYYYTQVIAGHGYQPKQLAMTVDTAGATLLGLGRGLFNLVWPYYVAPDYFPGQWQSLAGLVVIPVVALLALRLRHRLDFRWLLFTVLCLALPVVQVAWVFWLDTYLLGPLVGISLFAMSGFKFGWPSFRGARVLALVALATLGTIYGVTNKKVVASWKSTEALAQRSWEVGFNPRIGMFLATHHMNEGDFHKAGKYVEKVKARVPHHRLIPVFEARIALGDHSLSSEEQWQVLESLPENHPWTPYYRGFFYLANGQCNKALPLMGRVIERPAGRESLEELSADLNYCCEKLGGKKACERMLARAKQVEGESWSERRFEDRRQEFDGGVPPPL